MTKTKEKIQASNDLLCGDFTSRKGSVPRKFYKQKDATPEIVYMIIKKRLPKVRKNMPEIYCKQLDKLQKFSYLSTLSKDKLNKIRKRVMYLYNTEQIKKYQDNIISQMLQEQKEYLAG